MPNNPIETVRQARKLYRNLQGLTVTLQRWRPYICPFDVLLENIEPDSDALDIGCGGGLLLGLAAERGKLSRGIGVDTSGPGIEVAQRMSANNAFSGKLDFRQLDAGAELPDGPFDVVALIDVLHHIEKSNQSKSLKQAAMRVRPGGKLIIKEIATQPRWRALANQLHDLIIARQWVQHIHEDDIRNGIDVKQVPGRWLPEVRINTFWYSHIVLIFERSRL